MLAALVVLIAALLVVPDGRDGVTRASASTGAPEQATMTIDTLAPGQPVPSSYFGLSTEYWSLPIWEAHLQVFERVLAMVHAQGDGALLMRIGGDSADQSMWDPSASDLPDWEFALTPRWIAALGRLVHESALHVIIDLNVVTGSPVKAGEWAAAAERYLPRGSIVGFEVGNEEDIYSGHYWHAALARADLDPTVLATRYTPASYTEDFRDYAQVLARVAPGVPLLGPALALPHAHIAWELQLLASPHPGLAVVSAHEYPFSACVHRGSHAYPTIARLLSDRASLDVARAVAPAAELAHAAGLQFRLTELNSVTCGGVAGVSNSFATALWAPDILFRFLRVGVDGVNLHVRTGAINAPFAFTSRGLAPRPLLYGLIMFARTLGPQAALLPVRVTAVHHHGEPVPLSAWAVRLGGDRLHVLLIDKGYRSVRVRFTVASTGPAAVQRLLAPSPSSRTGVTLDGQHLGANGRWYGRAATQQIEPVAHQYAVTVRGASAVLVNFSPSPAYRAGYPAAAVTSRPAVSAARRLAPARSARPLTGRPRSPSPANPRAGGDRRE